MKIPRKFISLGVAIITSGVLFHYLSETLIQWRMIFSALLFLATYIMIDGFLRHT